MNLTVRIVLRLSRRLGLTYEPATETDFNHRHVDSPVVALGETVVTMGAFLQGALLEQRVGLLVWAPVFLFALPEAVRLPALLVASAVAVVLLILLVLPFMLYKHFSSRQEERSP